MEQEISLLELTFKTIRFFKRHLIGYLSAVVLAVIIAFAFNAIKAKNYSTHFRAYSPLTPKYLIQENISLLIEQDKQLNTRIDDFSFDSTQSFLAITLLSKHPLNTDSLLNVFDNSLQNDKMIAQYLDELKQETEIFVKRIEHLYNLNDSIFKASHLQTNKSIYGFVSWIPVSTLQSYTQKYYRLTHFETLAPIQFQYTYTNSDSMSFVKILAATLFVILSIATFFFLWNDLKRYFSV